MEAVQPALRLLVAEDNPLNQDLMMMMLEGLGHQVEVVENGLEVTQALQKSSFDAIFLDIHMPVMDGIETARWVHEQFATGKRPKIIAVSASLFSDEENPMKPWSDVCLTKPVSAPQLEAVLDLQVNRQVPESQAAESKVLDLELLKTNLGDDPEFLRSVIAVFLQEMKSDFERLQKAIHAQETLSILELAHKLKGSCLTVGASRVAKSLENLEETAKYRNTPLCLSILPTLESEVAELETILGQDFT